MPAALNRPEPVLRHRAQPVDRNVPPAQAAAWLLEGRSLLVTDSFVTGLDILQALRVQLEDPGEDSGYVKKRIFREAFQAASKNLLAPVVGRKVALADAPRAGFLTELYPDHADFALPIEDARVLSTAWGWYEKGVHFPVLGYRVHPFYGTYIPARMEHLELFGTWLAKYQGARNRAIDVGTGSGVLTLQMAKAGFQHVIATDINPNAIESVARQLRRLPNALPIELELADLLGTDRGPVDLIVSNPPWMKGEVGRTLDLAMYFQEGFFERFYDQALQRLAPGGRIVFVFSNIIELSQPDVPHPIQTELDRGRFRLVEKMTRRVKPSPGRRTREKVEVWELAVV
ncbi:MAG: class I SAM-dependent methyltransferase [Planctomycetes bacterium]|jgi:SAM-dependent methyltransferase|nr:class I SAM-dependent methyltransferase [Planctomycetota bacterium]